MESIQNTYQIFNKFLDMPFYKNFFKDFRITNSFRKNKSVRGKKTKPSLIFSSHVMTLARCSAMYYLI